MSQGYPDGAPASGPPPPKQPQSICSPRAQAEAIATTDPANSTAETTAAGRVSRPSTRQAPTTTSTTGSR